LLQLPPLQLHVVPPLGMLPTAHVPESPELEADPELEPLLKPELEPDEPELEPLPKPELEPDEPELEPLPEPELEPDEPELEMLPEVDEPEPVCPPELEPLEPPELDAPPSFPSDPPLLFSDEDEQEASTAMTAGRMRRTLALIANLHVREYAAA
jgi:fused signal recognition particle receptor